MKLPVLKSLQCWMLSTAYKYMCVINYKPYKPRRVQELLPSDFGLCDAFAHCAMAELDFNCVVWTDEAYFHLNGNVNSIRGSACSPAPVKVLHEQPLHSPKQTLLWIPSSLIIQSKEQHIGTC